MIQGNISLKNDQTPQKKVRTNKLKLNFNEFKCERIGKLDMNATDNIIYTNLEKKIHIGNAWSGINWRLDEKPIFYFGTQNGMAIRLNIIDPNQNEIKNESSMKNNQEGHQYNSVLGAQQILQHSQYIIDNLNNQGMSTPSQDSPSDNLQILDMKAIKIFSKTQACFQIGQLGEYILVSGKQNNQFQLYLLDKQLRRIHTLTSLAGSYHFTRASNDILIFRNTMSWEECSQIVFSKIVNGLITPYRRKIVLERIELFPTSLIVSNDLLFVGVQENKVYVYNIKKRKLIKIVDPDMNSYPKKITYYEQNKILVVVSETDEISFINLITNEVVVRYTLTQLFERNNVQFIFKYEIFLFNFINKDIVIIGGSFPFLFFVDWVTGRIIKQYTDYQNFVGAISYNNILYLTHENCSFITVLH